MTQSDGNRRGYRFAAYEVDLIAGELRKHGVKIRLQEQPFQVLASLLERGGELLPREEMQKKLWPAETFVDFDHGLNAAVARLREALCDSAENPRFVETIPRRGYRFLAPVHTLTGEAVAERRVMLAVLPFENLSSDSEQEYFADGMTEEMIAQLGRLSPTRLGVIARTSAMQYKHTSKSVEQIGKELEVEFVLEGSVRRAGERLRITSQLIQVKDQTHLWAETFDRNLEDILSIQTDVANRIAGSLAVELLPEQQAVMSRASTKDFVAYEAYLKGRYYWNKRTEEGFKKAAEYFQQAIEKEPNYALPWVGLADLYDVLGIYGLMLPKEAHEKAKAAAKKALELNGSLAEAHTSLAYASYLYDWDWAGAEREFKVSLELNPNHVAGHYWYALFLTAMGRFEESFARMRSALELDPLSLVTNCHTGWMFYFARQYDQAIEQLCKVLEMDPVFPLPHYFLGLAYLQKANYEKAMEEFRKVIESTNHQGALAALSGCCALAGKKAEGRKLMRDVEDTAKKKHLSPYLIALGYVGLGENDAAFRSLDKAFEERSPWLTNLKVEPVLDNLRSDSRFHDLMQRVGFASQ